MNRLPHYVEKRVADILNEIFDEFGLVIGSNQEGNTVFYRVDERYNGISYETFLPPKYENRYVTQAEYERLYAEQQARRRENDERKEYERLKKKFE